MRYGKPIVCALVLATCPLPITGVAADTTSASASARITLTIPARVQVMPPGGSGQPRLCLGHIPARRYYLVVERGADSGLVGRLEGRDGSYCLPAEITENASGVTVVAQ